MTMVIHEKPPFQLKLRLKSAPSCKESNIIIFTSSSKVECPLTSDGDKDGAVACVYSCGDPVSTKITIGFLKPINRPSLWSLCEVYPV